MTKYIVLYLACAAVMLPLDFLWLSTMGRTFYQREIGGILLERPNFVIAALFYLAYVVGIVALVAAPAEGDIGRAVLFGAILGLVAYGTYDLTNLSTLKGYTPTIAVVDLAWGTFVTAASAGIGVWIARAFGQA